MDVLRGTFAADGGLELEPCRQYLLWVWIDGEGQTSAEGTCGEVYCSEYIVVEAELRKIYSKLEVEVPL